MYTYYVSTALFAIFGIRMLREGLKMSPDEGQEELEEVQAELKKKDEEVSCHWYMPKALGDTTLLYVWVNLVSFDSSNLALMCFWLL